MSEVLVLCMSEVLVETFIRKIGSVSEWSIGVTYSHKNGSVFERLIGETLSARMVEYVGKVLV